jgi:hypothetical protein
MIEIPDGWVRMSFYDTREDKSTGGPSSDYRRLLAASKKNPPEFGVQNIRGVYGTLVKKDEADLFLRRFSEAEVSRSKPSASREQDSATTELLKRMESVCDLLGKLVEKLS